jgi:phage repressor protein C with HTH and peptisase S24 domain
MLNTIQEAYNLVEIRKLYGLSQTEFARKVKMSRELVSKIENGKAELKKPTIRKIQRFLEHHTLQTYSQDVNFLGKPSHPDSHRSSSPYYHHRREQKNEPGFYMVPLVGIKAQAGYIKGYEHVDYLDTLEKYSLPPGVNPTGATWCYFEVDGDSMEPSFHGGDLILATMLPHEDWNDVKDFCVYIILTKDRLMVKRVYRKNEQEWVLISDHEEAYPPVLLAVSEIRQVWTFRRHIRSRVPQPREFPGALAGSRD